MADTSCLFSLFHTDFPQYDHRSTAKFYVFVPSQRACACTHMFIKREISFYQQYLVRSAYICALKWRSFYFKNWYFIISVFSNVCQISASLFTILFLPFTPFISLLSLYSPIHTKHSLKPDMYCDRTRKLCARKNDPSPILSRIFMKVQAKLKDYKYLPPVA